MGNNCLDSLYSGPLGTGPVSGARSHGCSPTAAGRQYERKESSDDRINNPDRCFQAGKDDGRDSQFSQSEFDTCGSSYEHGFMKGCLSVDGNTRDVCNSAEDAG